MEKHGQDRPAGCGGNHTPFDAADEPGDRFGRPGEQVSGELLGELAAAAFEGCTVCQRMRLDAMQEDPLTATRFVEVAAVAVNDMAGGLPAGMLTESGPSTFSGPFREVMRAGVDQDDHVRMYEVVAGLPVEQRRQVLEDAVDLLVGVLALGE